MFEQVNVALDDIVFDFLELTLQKIGSSLGKRWKIEMNERI